MCENKAMEFRKINFFKNYEIEDFKQNQKFLSKRALNQLKFKSMGKNVYIARNSTVIGTENISIGNNVRIDSNVVIIAISGYLKIGNYVHIGSGSYLGCSNGIEIKNFSGISSDVKIFSASDDFSGNFLTNPTIPNKYRGITGGKVVLHEHVVIGSGTVILPELEIGRSSSVGALSLVNRSLEEFGIYFGTPVRKIGIRNRYHLNLAKQLTEKE